MKKLFLVTLFLLCLPQAFIFAGDALDERQRAYTVSLYKSGDYFQCIDEIRKGVFYWNRSQTESDYFILCSYFSGGQYSTVLSRLNASDTPAQELRMQMLLSQTYLRLGDYSNSAQAASLLFYTDFEEPERYNIFARRIEPLLYLENYEAALAELDVYKKMNDPYNGITALEQELSGYHSIPRRSKARAMLFSALLPGAGQVYSGRYLDGLLSLSGVAASGALGGYLHNRGERRLAYGAFFLTALFYAGNLYGAYNSASEFNSRHSRLYREKIRAKYFSAYEPADYLNYEGTK